MPTKLTARSRNVPSKSKPQISPDQLAEQLAGQLKIKDEQEQHLLDEDSRISAMRTVNSASQELSSIVKSGWKMSSEPTPKAKQVSSTASRVVSLAKKAQGALERLRRGGKEEDASGLDVERAAGSLISKLVALDMYDIADEALRETQIRLVHLYKPSSRETPHTLSLPLLSEPITCNTTLTLLTTFLTHAIVVACNTLTVDSLAELLAAPSTLLRWIEHLPHDLLPDNHRNPILTRVYSSILRASSAKPGGSALSTFRIREYAFSCILYVSTIEPDSVWDQVVKSARVFVHAGGDEDAVLQAILDAYGRLVERARQIDRPLLQGSKFISFCESWMNFAKRGNNSSVMDRIQRVMRSSAGAQPSAQSEADSALESAQVSAVLGQATIALEHLNAGASEDNCTQRLEDARQILQDFRDRCSPSAEKLCRTLDKLRRASTIVLEKSLPSATMALVKDVLEGTVNAIQKLLTIFTTSPDATDLYARMLDSLFVLSRSILIPSDPRSYAPSYDYLRRASSLVNSATTDKLASYEKSRLTRSISSAAHILAVKLYQDDKSGAAIKFLQDGCTLGEAALAMRNGESKPQSEEDEKERERWKQLEETLYRRWELLGVCFSKAGDRRGTFDSFIKSIISFPFSGASFAERLSSASLQAAFDSSPALKQVGILIDRLTQLGAGELFLDPSVVCLHNHAPALPPSLTGAIVERQLATLEGGLWKEGIRPVAFTLLKILLDLYDASDMPIRRARVLLKFLELSYRFGNELLATGRQTAAGIGQDILSLCTHQNLHKDSALHHFCSQYSISVHLWLALHAHRTSASATDVNLDNDVVVNIQFHIEEACKLMQEIANDKDPNLNSKAPQKSLQKGVKAASGSSSSVPRRTTARKVATKTPAAKLPPVTPKAKSRKGFVALEPVSIDVETIGKAQDQPKVGGIEDFEELGKFVNLLETVSYLAGLIGLIVPKVHLLHSCRRMLDHHGRTSTEEYTMISMELAHEYHRIGRSKRAINIQVHAVDAARAGGVSKETLVKLLLRYSECLAAGEEVGESSSLYCEAACESRYLADEDKNAPTTQRIMDRVGRLERAAMAAYTFASIQNARGNIMDSLQSLLRSLRLWNRATDALSRLHAVVSQNKKSEADDNPFEAAETKDSTQHQPTPAVELPSQTQKSTFQPRTSMDGIEWRISTGLLHTLSSLSKLYFRRGSAREAEFFAQQLFEFSTALHLPARISSSLAHKADIQLYQGLLEDSRDTLIRAVDLLNDATGEECAELNRLQGEWNRRCDQEKDAADLYEEAFNILDSFDHAFKTFEKSRKSIAASSTTSQAGEVLLPSLVASILRQHVWLLRHEAGEQFSSLLVRYMALPKSPQIQLDQNALMARLSLYDVYQLFQSDMFLSSIPESTIALPMGARGDKLPSLSPTCQEILQVLDSAERHFWTDLSYVSKAGDIAHIRETLLSLALVKTLQTSLGRAVPGSSMTVAGLLDASTVITLRRDMLETIENKFNHLSASDDLSWPLLEKDGTPLPAEAVPESTRRRARLNFNSQEDLCMDDEDISNKHLREYWESVKQKYTLDLEESTVAASRAALLPSNWTVYHISITPDKNTLFVSRQRGGPCNCSPQSTLSDESPSCSCGTDPLVFCIPMKNRRETPTGEQAEEHLTFEDALKELGEIIRLSDEGTRGGASIRDNASLDERKQWWKGRSDLDQRMKTLVENIEFCWFGAFKTVFSPQYAMDAEFRQQLRASFDKVFERNLRLQQQDKKKARQSTKSGIKVQSNHIILDDVLLECFSSLSPKCRDEELEDLAYFVLDSLQFQGVPVTVAEVDIDSVVMDLRTALEECAGKRAAAMRSQKIQATDEHAFLVLGKELQGIPWESIPVLRGRSTSRIPDIEFLIDRVKFSQLKKNGDVEALGSVSNKNFVDPRKTFYVLNPSGDLNKTEGRFKNWASDLHKVGWEGICGKPPSEQQLLNALSEKDLVIYFGHGGGEQYVRSHKVRNLPKCAATMLWGCSSGALKDMGDFDRMGTPVNYMLAGCPTLVANLWDVTDRDIDKFSQSVFDKLGIRAAELKKPNARKSKEVSVVSAVAQSRDACKLRYLTGAAPVVYGIPFYL